MSDFDQNASQSDPSDPFSEGAGEPAPEMEGEPVSAPQEQSDDPIEESLYTSFMQAVATGADSSQAFNVAVYAAKQVALDHEIPEDAFDRIAADLFGPYSQALNEGQPPQEALRVALQSLEG